MKLLLKHFFFWYKISIVYFILFFSTAWMHIVRNTFQIANELHRILNLDRWQTFYISNFLFISKPLINPAQWIAYYGQAKFLNVEMYISLPPHFISHYHVTFLVSGVLRMVNDSSAQCKIIIMIFTNHLITLATGSYPTPRFWYTICAIHQPVLPWRDTETNWLSNLGKKSNKCSSNSGPSSQEIGILPLFISSTDDLPLYLVSIVLDTKVLDLLSF